MYKFEPALPDLDRGYYWSWRVAILEPEDCYPPAVIPPI